MPFQVNKKKSKRQSCRTRYKIEKKVRGHNKKLKKEENKKTGKGRKKAEKPLELQIPNKCPFKGEILLEAKEKREQLEQDRMKRRVDMQAMRKAERAKKVAEKRKESTTKKTRPTAQPKTLESLVAGAEQRQNEFELEQTIQELGAEGEVLKGNKTKGAASVRAYASEVRKVLESADVVFEVIDARDPLGSRCESVEKQVIGAGKKLVLLLNKIDLVPKKNVEQWLTYLRARAPTLAFKASTQEQKNNLGRAGGNMSTISSKCLGAELVMKLLGNYCRNKDIKSAIRVGVIGFPNVGKSSVINSLKRTRTCNVGATPGVTKYIQEVELDKHIKLLDSPGVVLAEKGNLDSVEIALRNAVKVENIEDPVAPVEAILRRCSKDTMMLQYGISSFEDPLEFLRLIARKNGKLLKGARPDVTAAARRVLQDWNTGKLKYYTQPPEEESPAPEYLSAEVVSSMGKEFNIDDLGTDENMMVQDLPANVDAVLYAPPLINSDGVTEEVEMGDEKDAVHTVVEAAARPSRGGSPKPTNDDPMTEAMTRAEAEIPGNQQLNKRVRMKVKKQRKKDLRSRKLGSKLAASMERAMDIDASSGEDYDFETDFSKA